jgi:hypothetical protein
MNDIELKATQIRPQGKAWETLMIDPTESKVLDQSGELKTIMKAGILTMLTLLLIFIVIVYTSIDQDLSSDLLENTTCITDTECQEYWLYQPQ